MRRNLEKMKETIATKNNYLILTAKNIYIYIDNKLKERATVVNALSLQEHHALKMLCIYVLFFLF